MTISFPSKSGITKTCALLCLLLIGNFAAVNAQSANTIKIGIDGTNPPFSHTNIDGEFSGLEIDLSNALCKAMKVKCEFVPLEWGRLISALRGKKIDLIIGGVIISDKRRKLIDFSTPYLQLPHALVTHTETILSGLTNDDMQDAQLGVLQSSPYSEYVATHLPLAHVKTYQDDTTMFTDLANRQLDGVVGDPVALSRWLSSADGTNCCKLLGTLPYDPQINGEGFAIGMRKNEGKRLEQVNKTLAKLQKSGRLKKIISAHLPFLK